MAKGKLTQQQLNRILRGSHGHVWWNGRELATVQKIENKMTGDFEDINVCGDPATYAVYNGWSGEGTLEQLKVDSENAHEIVQAMLSGDFPECEIIALLENPSTGKRERCRVGLVTFTEASIATFEKKSIITESIPYKFSDFEFLETISA